MKRETRIALERVEAEGARVQTLLDAARASPLHNRDVGSVMNLCRSGCPACVETDRWWAEWSRLTREYKELKRLLRSEENQTYLNRKPSGPRAAATRSRVMKARREKLSAEVADQDLSVRGLAKKKAPDSKKPRTTQRDLEAIRKSRHS